MPSYRADSTPPIKISKTTWVSAPAYLITAFAAAIGGAVLVYADLLSTDEKYGVSIRNVENQAVKHDERIFKLEQAQNDIKVMQNDITWIRKGLEDRKVIQANQSNR